MTERFEDAEKLKAPIEKGCGQAGRRMHASAAEDARKRSIRVWRFERRGLWKRGFAQAGRRMNASKKILLGGKDALELKDALEKGWAQAGEGCAQAQQRMHASGASVSGEGND